MNDPLLDNPCLFAGNPLDRTSAELFDADENSPKQLADLLARPDAQVLPLWRGDPLMTRGDAPRPAWLAAGALGEFPKDAAIVFLGLGNGTPFFAVDASAAPGPDAAPFSDIGTYTPLREAAGFMDLDANASEMAIVGQARWLLDWHWRHQFCARCGAASMLASGGGKRLCPACGAEHFPRSDPVAIVLALHEDACLLGRSPHFPPGFFSALAGYVEACETPEECAVRELKEEAGLVLSNVRYQFSQPWPFPSSLMMGFFADAASRALTLDQREIVAAVWLSRNEIVRLLNGETVKAGANEEDVRLPPRFTIARQLIERWANGQARG